MHYRVILEVDEDGMVVAECPVLPGCISQGRTRQEALANIKDAIAGYLESLRKHGEPLTIRRAATSFRGTPPVAG